MIIKDQKEPEGITLPNLSNYIITEDGSVWTHLKQRFLKPAIHTQQYRMFFLTEDTGNKKWYKAHRLVATAYHENPENKPCVGHVDNNPANNHKDNLVWCTHKENTQHAIKSGSFNNMPKGEAHALYGKPVPEETKQKMRFAKVGSRHPKFRGFIEINGKQYESATEAAKEIGVSTMTVCKWIKKGLAIIKP